MNKNTTFNQNVNTVGDFLVQHVLKNPQNPVIPYSELGEETGTNRRGLGPILGEIGRRCKANYLPDITSIVVCKDTQKPGKAFLAHTPDAWLEIVRVQRYDWQSVIAENLLYLPMPGYEDDQLLAVFAKLRVLFVDTHETDVLEGNFRAKPYNHKTMPQLIVGHDRHRITDIKIPVAWFDLKNGRSRCEVIEATAFAHLIGQPISVYVLVSRNPVRYFNC